MVIFHVFKIGQMVPNRATHHKMLNCFIILFPPWSNKTAISNIFSNMINNKSLPKKNAFPQKTKFSSD